MIIVAKKVNSPQEFWFEPKSGRQGAHTGTFLILSLAREGTARDVLRNRCSAYAHLAFRRWSVPIS